MSTLASLPRVAPEDQSSALARAPDVGGKPRARGSQSAAPGTRRRGKRRPARDPHRRRRSRPTTSPPARRSSGCSKPTPGSSRSPIAWSRPGSTARPRASSSTCARTGSSRITPAPVDSLWVEVRDALVADGARATPGVRRRPDRARARPRARSFRRVAPTGPRVRQARHGRVPVPVVLRARRRARSTISRGSASAPATCPLAVELRNREWLDTEHRDSTMKFFEEHRLSYVCVDVPPGFPSSLPPLTVATTDLAVVRFHGRNGDAWERGADTGDDRMSYDYRRGDLEPWAPRLAKLAGAAKSVHVLFTTGHGRRRPRRDARLLVRVLTEEPRPEPPPPPQEGTEAAPPLITGRRAPFERLLSNSLVLVRSAEGLGRGPGSPRQVRSPHGDADRRRDHRHDDRVPAQGHERGLRVHHASDQGSGVEGRLRLPGRVHVQAGAREGVPRRRRPDLGHAPRDGPVGDREGRDRRRRRRAASASSR